MEIEEDEVFDYNCLKFLSIKYTVVSGWRSPADKDVGLGGLTVQAHCLSRYSHYPPPQNYLLTKELSYGLLWKMGMGLGQERYFYMHSERSSLVLIGAKS